MLTISYRPDLTYTPFLLPLILLPLFGEWLSIADKELSFTLSGIVTMYPHCDRAIQEQVDAIIMGSHGRGVIAEQFLGSVAEKVVRKIPVAVANIRPKGMRERLIERWHHLSK